MSVYRSGPLEPISPAFEHRNPYLTNDIYVDLETLQNLGFDLTDHLGKYMNWLGIQNDYSVSVLRVFYQSLCADVKTREKDKQTLVAGVRFSATVRGRHIEFDWKIINQILGITDPILNKWKYHRRFPSDQLKDAYGTEGKKVSGMTDHNRVIQYIYSRIMTHKGGNFSEFTQLDNPLLES